MTTRRQFLSQSAALSFLGGTGALTGLAQQAQAANTSGYKALVCVFFFGGQDCHDTVLPYDQTSYDKYAQHRSNLLEDYGPSSTSSRARANLLPLIPANQADFGTKQFALPPELAPMKTLFDAGNAAIIGNVGPLIRPVTRAEIEAKTADLPKRLFSHNDQQSTWMSSAPEGEIMGWGGKFSDAVVGNDPTFTSVSTFGNSVFLSGDSVAQYSLSQGGPSYIRGAFKNDNSLLGTGSSSSTALNLLLDHYGHVGAVPTNLVEQDIMALHQSARTNNATFLNALDSAPTLQTDFPRNRLGNQLKDIANTIAIRGTLGKNRQVFFAGLGGFDTHDGQAASMERLHSHYAQAIAAFYESLSELGVENDVTLFTASDFGRTLVENGNGTDHGWGGHHFVVGGGVDGNKIFGDIPPPSLEHDQDAGNGRLIPTTSVEQYAATLGRWFGLSTDELNTALPNLSNFPSDDLGFMTP